MAAGRASTSRPPRAAAPSARATLALVYDFDGTLTPQPMQEYTVLPQLGLSAEFRNTVGPGRPLRRGLPVAALLAALTACAVPDLKPDFLKDEAPAAEAVAADPSLTPRELITARLVNAREEDAAMPGMTVGKLVEFADRYLACDCSAARFAKAWRRIEGGYELDTNSQAAPLRFACSGSADNLACYLREIDRGPAAGSLTERFMPGSDFVQFIYRNGLQCERTEPCPAPAAAP